MATMTSAAWLLALMLADAAAPFRHIVPRTPAAATYESRPATVTGFQPFGDQLRTAVQRAAIEAGRRRGTKVVPDARLDAAMSDLARSLRDDEQPRGDAVEFVLEHHGIVEPYPAMRTARGPRESEAQIIELLTRDIPLPDGKPLATLGVGIDRATSWIVVVVGTQAKSLDLDPVPRQLPHAAKARVSGKLLGAYAQPHLYVTDPTGAARTLPASAKGPAFEAELACDRGDGRYQVEVFGTDATGPTVLANFPIYCGAAPPKELAGAAGYGDVGRLKPAEVEAKLLELVNRDRRAAGLPPLEADSTLAAVARAHSQDMLGNELVAHVSPTTGGPGDRIKRAGLKIAHFAENVAQAGTPEEVEQGLMASPGHRSAILSTWATHVGIGVAVTPGNPTPSVYATQLFR